MLNICSAVHLVCWYKQGWSQIISTSHGINLGKNMLDKTIYALHNSDMQWWLLQWYVVMVTAVICHDGYSSDILFAEVILPPVQKAWTQKQRVCFTTPDNQQNGFLKQKNLITWCYFKQLHPIKCWYPKCVTYGPHRAHKCFTNKITTNMLVKNNK
jgi:hypothetical protein